MKTLRITLAIISFIIGIIMIFTISGIQAAYFAAFFMIVSIALLYYAKKEIPTQEQQEQEKPVS